MENNKLGEHSDISTSLIETSHLQPDLNQTELDFIQQNAIIDQELQKHDGHLNTWAMCLFKAWMVLYLIICSISIPGFIVLLYVYFHDFNNTALAVHILELFDVLFYFASIYAMVFLWKALRSKDPFKAEKSVSIFKIYLLWSIFSIFSYYALSLYLGFAESVFTQLGKLTMSLVAPAINLWTALYVRKVLVKRNPFQEVSSH